MREGVKDRLRKNHKSDSVRKHVKPESKIGEMDGGRADGGTIFIAIPSTRKSQHNTRLVRDWGSVLELDAPRSNIPEQHLWI